MSGRSRSPRQRPLGSRRIEGDLKKAFDLIADVFDNATNDLGIVFRIENTRDWCVNDMEDVTVTFLFNKCNSTGFLEDYFKRKLRDPNCTISYVSENDKHHFLLNTNYTRILSFYSFRYWIVDWAKKNTAWIILFGLILWYFTMTIYGFYFQSLEGLNNTTEES